jgi:hypothetical protein
MGQVTAMNSDQLLDALKETGTGEMKLETARKWMEERHELRDSRKLLNTMRDERLWPEGTLEKAEKLLAGAAPQDMQFQGVPPQKGPDAAEAMGAAVKPLADKLDQLVEAVKEKSHERQAEAQARGVAQPVRRSAAHDKE